MKNSTIVGNEALKVKRMPIVVSSYNTEIPLMHAKTEEGKFFLNCTLILNK